MEQEKGDQLRKDEAEQDQTRKALGLVPDFYDFPNVCLLLYR